MIQQRVEELVNKVFGAVAKKVKVAKLTVVINKFDKLNVYGYLRYMKELHGTNLFFYDSLYNEESIKKYKFQCEQEHKDLPQHIYNAGLLFEGLVSSKLGTDEAFERLAEMVEPHVMYLLLKSSGFPADNYYKEAKRYYMKFPGAVECLPDTFKECKEALRDDALKLA